MDKYGKQRLRPPFCGHSERHGGKLYAPRKPTSSNAPAGAQPNILTTQPQRHSRNHSAPERLCCVFRHNFQGNCKKTCPDRTAPAVCTSSFPSHILRSLWMKRKNAEPARQKHLATNLFFLLLNTQPRHDTAATPSTSTNRNFLCGKFAAPALLCCLCGEPRPRPILAWSFPPPPR